MNVSTLTLYNMGPIFNKLHFLDNKKKSEQKYGSKLVSDQKSPKDLLMYEMNAMYFNSAALRLCASVCVSSDVYGVVRI